jgi:hypothetical protein
MVIKREKAQAILQNIKRPDSIVFTIDPSVAHLGGFDDRLKS